MLYNTHAFMISWKHKYKLMSQMWSFNYALMNSDILTYLQSCSHACAVQYVQYAVPTQVLVHTFFSAMIEEFVHVHDSFSF